MALFFGWGYFFSKVWSGREDSNLQGLKRHQHPRLDGYQITVLRPDWQRDSDSNRDCIVLETSRLPLSYPNVWRTTG